MTSKIPILLRDVYCSDCERVVVDVHCGGEATLYCPDCHANTTHLPVCNGGTGYRVRVNDFPDDPAFWRDQVRYSGVRVREGSSDGPAALNTQTGQPLHDEKRFLEDATSERLEKTRFKTDSKRGRTPLYFDRKGKTT